MKIRAAILVLSLFSTTILISGGYGYWQQDLIIKGDITVVRPDPEPIVIAPLIEQTKLIDTIIVPVDNSVKGSPTTGSQSDEQLPKAPESTDIDAQEPKQVEEQGNIEDETKQIEPIDPSDQINEEPDSSNEDNNSKESNEFKENVDSIQSESKEKTSEPQDKVGNEK